MACCGSNRKKQESPDWVQVRWIGDGMKKVTGPASGQIYRFSGYGSVVIVDKRDLAGVLGHKGMVQVGG